MSFVVMEIGQHGMVRGELHRPAERRHSATTWGGTTFSRYERMDGLELPYHWPTKCGAFGVVYRDVAYLSDWYERCEECEDG